jgi:hypothetical protein
MAKRRKRTTTKRTYRRRRVSGVQSPDITGLALTVGGALAATIISKKLAASTNATFSKLAPFAPLALGIVLPMLVKNQMLKTLSIGLVAGGGVTALGPTGLKIVSGIQTIGYPYQNQLPYKKVAGVGPGGTVTNRTGVNWSGSMLSQPQVIGGVPAASAMACSC